ncbi:MAG: hypothetical protein IT336_01980 [Thermomicrobiales bacterium]|nr:hypothetical protein [Thermomicrobiales bacterium]
MVHRTSSHQPNPAPRWAGFALIAALALMLASALWTPAAAQEPEMPKLGIKPAGSGAIFFAETLAPGEHADLTVEIANAGTVDIAALTYAADVYTLVNGGLGVRLAGDPVSGPTTWLDYPTSTLDLPHGEGRELTFTVTVPEDAGPGEYVTSLVVQNAEAVQGSGDLTVNQILRQAIAVAITVPGETHPALEIGEVTYQRNPLIDSLLIEVRNTGNLHLKPSGTFSIVDAAGNTVVAEEIGMDSIYAGTATVIEIGLATPFPAGDYRISANLADGERGGAASIADRPFQVGASESVDTVSLIETFAVELVTAADGKTVQFAAVSAGLMNPGGRIADARLILRVERDGELIEEYPLLSGAAIETGQSSVQQRYLPLAGWAPGVYQFSLRLESGDPATGAFATIATSAEPIVAAVE